MAHRFGPAYRDEAIVFGASRPGYDGKNVSLAEVQEWIRFVKGKGIERVVCLLTEDQIAHYQENLLDNYREAFGSGSVLHAPIENFHLSTWENLQRILGFLEESERLGKKTVVHCSGGSGRTGHVLAAWLVRASGLDPVAAIEAVESAEPPRCPREAVNEATEHKLVDLLASGRRAGD